jgi:hypothetical protein
LLRLERVVHARDQPDERLARPLDHRVVARELLAHHDTVERRPPQGIRDLLPASPRLAAAQLFQVVPELLERGPDRPFLLGRGVHARQHGPDEEAFATDAPLPALRTEFVAAE